MLASCRAVFASNNARFTVWLWWNGTLLFGWLNFQFLSVMRELIHRRWLLTSTSRHSAPEVDLWCRLVRTHSMTVHSLYFLNLFYFPQKCEKIDCSINANSQNPQKTWNSNFAFEKHVVGNQCTCWLIFRFNFWCFSQKIHKIQFLHGNESVPMQTNGFLSLLQNHRIYYKRRSSFIGAVPIC